MKIQTWNVYIEQIPKYISEKPQGPYVVAIDDDDEVKYIIPDISSLQVSYWSAFIMFITVLLADNNSDQR